jgi:hypothetical protein
MYDSNFKVFNFTGNIENCIICGDVQEDDAVGKDNSMRFLTTLQTVHQTLHVSIALVLI